MHRSQVCRTMVLAVALAGLPIAAAAQPVPPSDGRAEMAATLVRLLGDPDQRVRAHAQGALTAARPAEAVPLLIPMLNDADPDRVRLAITILAGFPSSDAQKALVKLAEEKKGDVRLQVAQALMMRREISPELLRFYDGLSRDPDARLRVLAIAALGNRLLPYQSGIVLTEQGISLNAGQPARSSR